MKDEKGQALPLALVALAVGGLLVTPFLRSVSVNSIASRNYSGSIAEQYSSDAGVEDAIWNLTNGTLAAELTAPGDTASYSLSESVNGVVPTISVTRDRVNLATDDFESGGWSGGSGWVDAWHRQGSSSVTGDGSPYEGSYHLGMEKGNSYVERAANLSGQSGLHLQFQAKVSAFEGDDYMECLVSPDDTNWTAVKTWTSADSDDTYHFVDIDLAPYTMSSEFWIAFDSGMNSNKDYFYVDDLRIVWAIAYEIVSSAGSEKARADIFIQDGNVSISSWQMERQQE